jgi:hypothetical protein
MFTSFSHTFVLLQVFSYHEMGPYTDSRRWILYGAVHSVGLQGCELNVLNLSAVTAFFILPYITKDCHHSRRAIPKFEAHSCLQHDVITRDIVCQGHRWRIAKLTFLSTLASCCARVKNPLLGSYTRLCLSPHNSATPTGWIFGEFNTGLFFKENIYRHI